MTDLEFRLAGEMIFGGEGWRQAMAALLAVNIRTVQRWANGQNEIPEQIAQAVARVIDATEAQRNRHA